jgi:ADP-heptose:LPS heptosyltransferase
MGVGVLEKALGPVERMAVFRAGSLGDVLCATPALRALRAGFPNAEITLVGLSGSRLLTQRLACVDDMLDFPGYPGLPGSNLHELPEFLTQVQARQFDLAVQLQGNGEVSNPLVATFGARHMAGFRNEASWFPAQDERWMVRWHKTGPEIERLLQLTDAMGLPRVGTHLDFPLQAEDRYALNELWPGAACGLRPYVCVNPGARLASRRWPLERFAAVGDALVRAGYAVVLTGTAAETQLVNEVARHMRHKAVNLVGLTSLWTLGALIERAHGVVCNDTGVSHVAAALRRPSVVISNEDDASATRWQPLNHDRHHFLAQDTSIREPHRCEAGVAVEEVLRGLELAVPQAPQPPQAVVFKGRGAVAPHVFAQGA